MASSALRVRTANVGIIRGQRALLEDRLVKRLTVVIGTFRPVLSNALEIALGVLSLGRGRVGRDEVVVVESDRTRRYRQ